MPGPASVRFDPDVAKRLAAFVATHPGLGASAATNLLVDEALRSQEHPLVVFLDGPAGRVRGWWRAVRLRGRPCGRGALVARSPTLTLTRRAPVRPLVYTSDASFPRNRRYVSRMVEALDAALKTDAVDRHGGVLWLPPSD